MDSELGALADDANDPEPPINAVGGVVYRWSKSGRLEILLIKKQGGFWTLPKGRVKVGEDDHQAVLREVAEETNIVGAVEAFVRQVVYQVRKGDRIRHKTVTYYLVRANGGRPRPDAHERIIHVRWFPVEVALERIHRKRIREIVRDAQLLFESRPSEA